MVLRFRDCFAHDSVSGIFFASSHCHCLEHNRLRLEYYVEFDESSLHIDDTGDRFIPDKFKYYIIVAWLKWDFKVAVEVGCGTRASLWDVDGSKWHCSSIIGFYKAFNAPADRGETN